MGRKVKAATCHGVVDSHLEDQSRSPEPDAYELRRRLSITPEPGNLREQANSPLVEVSRSNALDHLSANERDILDRQLTVPPIKVPYTMLYRYASKTDIFIIIVSAVCAIASGAVMPLMTVCTIVRRMKIARLAAKTSSRLFSDNWEELSRDSSRTLSQTLNSTICLVDLPFISYTSASESS